MSHLQDADGGYSMPVGDASGGSDPIQVDRVFGLTAQSNASVCATASGLLAYTAGCVAVIYDPELNTQTRLFKTDFAISSIATTIDGRFIALGCRNSEAVIKIFEIHSGEEVATLRGHNYGVGCMAFSQDGKVLVSCGYKLDKQLYVWNWAKKQGMSAKIGNKVNSVCFNLQGGYFVTCGDRHLKWWFFSRAESTGEITEIKGHPASIMEAQRYSNFTDCCFGTGTARHTLYCCTATGLLCTFHENRIMDKAIQLNCSSANCITAFTSQLLIGCSDGACYIYNIADLSHVGTFPFPDALPLSAVQYATAEPPSPSSLHFAACYAVRPIPNCRLVAIVYADRSMIIWDVVDFKQITKQRLFPNHRACIWDIHFLLNGAAGSDGNGIESFSGHDELSTSPFPSSTFVTCSADSSIRFWTLDPKGSRQSAWRIPFSKDALRVIDTGADDPDFALEQHVLFDLRKDTPDLEHPYRVQHATSPRSLAVHPNRKEIVSGHRSGHINVYSLNAKTGSAGKSNNPDLHILAHESEVLSLSFSPAYTTAGALSIASPTRRSMEVTDKSAVLLASGGRDGLIHIFDASSSAGLKKERFSLLSTLPVHSSAVSIVKFTPDGRKLISCGMSDRTMVFSAVTVDDETKSVSKLKSVSTPEGTVNGLTIDATNKYVITSGQGKRLNIWAINSGRQARSYHLEHAVGELFRSDIDPSGMFIATCSLDRKIRIFDFFSGDVIAEVTGHSDAITGIKFSPDGRYLVSVGGDGCIIVWRVPPTLVSAMQDRLLEMYATAQRKLRAAREAAVKTEPEPQLSLPSNDTGVNTIQPGTKVASLSSLVDSEPATSGRIKRPTPDAPPAPPVAKIATIPPDVPAIPNATSASPPRSKVTTSADGASVPPPMPPPFMPPAPPAPAPAGTSPSESISVNQSQSRWASRLKEGDADGYELFGRKINVSGKEGEKLRNKFTLQLSPDMTVEIPSADAPLSPGERISAERYEVNDDVVISPKGSGARDDDLSDNDTSDANGNLRASPILNKSQEDDDGKLNNSSKRLDGAHSSAAHLGSWLDNQLGDATDIPSTKRSSSKNILSSSLSGAYFADLKAGKITAPEEPESPVLDTSVDDGEVDPYDDSPSPVKNQSAGETPLRLRNARAGADMESQRKRTVDAVSQMRERLSAMGILDKEKGLASSSPQRLPKGTSDSQNSLSGSLGSPSRNKNVTPIKTAISSPGSAATSSLTKPVSMNSLDVPSKDDENDDENDTASTVSATRDLTGFELPSDDFDVDQEEIEERTRQCALAMQQLEKAAADAAAAMESLQSIRNSLVRRSSTAAVKTSGISSSAAKDSAKRSSAADFPAPGVSSSPSKRSSSDARTAGVEVASSNEGDAMLQMVDASLARMKERYSSLAASVSQSSMFDRF